MSKSINLVVISVLLYVSIVFSAVPGRNSISLYNSNDKLHILTSQNFSSNVYESKTAWLVEFYASWCGHCQAYAKTMREVGVDTWEWRTVVRIGVINCYSEDNNAICDQHNVRAYPTLRFIEPETTKNTSKVVDVTASDAKTVERDLINRLTSLQRTDDSWPKFGLMTFATLKDLFAQTSSSIKVIFVIVEERNGFSGRQIMLDFSKYYRQMTIFRTTINSTLWQQQNILITNTPSLFAILLNNTIEQLFVATKNETVGNRNSFNQAIRSYINQKKLIENFVDKEFEDLQIRGSFIRNDGSKQSTSISVDKNIDVASNDKEHQKISMLDLETGLSYMLRREIPRQKEIQGESYDALLNWLIVLNKYFPGRQPIMAYLKRLLTKVKEQTNGITGHQFRALAENNVATAYLPDKIMEYQFCAGSSSQYRGYPCSLWTLFHTLTVSQAASLENEQYDVFEIPRAIKGYIKIFFGCKHCGENFMKETSGMDKLEPKSKYEVMMYFWEIHNSVNKRLAGDTTEDPKHPKVQFPSNQVCPQCYVTKTEGTKQFNTKNIIDFLLKFYSKENIDLSSVYNYKVDETEDDAESRHPRRGIVKDRKTINVIELDSNDSTGYIPSFIQKFPFYFLVAIIFIAFLTRKKYCKLKQKRHTV